MTGVDTILLGDITYGACCVDDFTASMLGAQLLVHYGHSCLVPTTVANHIDTIYVFVTIDFDIPAAIESVSALLLTPGITRTHSTKTIGYEEENASKQIKVTLVSTIQFANSLTAVKNGLEESGKILATIPRSKPLSSGEILGCTAPRVIDDVIVYIGDGRFHLEAIMMANPTLPAYRYDPYNKTLTKEELDHEAMCKDRQVAVGPLLEAGQNKKVGLIQGTLGRQGNPKPVEYLFEKLSARHDCFVVLMSEVVPAKLALFEDQVETWVQFACPRLSIDWGSAFSVPLLTSYEASWAFDENMKMEGCCGGYSSCKSNGDLGQYKSHPMDYYAYDSIGPHTPNHVPDFGVKKIGSRISNSVK